MSAQFFCLTSEQLGKTARFPRLEEDVPNVSCGVPYRTACEATFWRKVKDMCPRYTTGEQFERYYRASHGGACSFNPNNPN